MNTEYISATEVKAFIDIYKRLFRIVRMQVEPETIGIAVDEYNNVIAVCKSPYRTRVVRASTYSLEAHELELVEEKNRRFEQFLKLQAEFAPEFKVKEKEKGWWSSVCAFIKR
ncbi:hypothetical protein [Bacteroides sp.]|uniref:hypothetical protein n=1 Tax=Bacteroides sp. TaxID=29523 RepID=UPI00260C0BF4|nr:hypothetical protein [Bacteroides sp.]MDD3040547.1 hypothetical protein [Bacteroides sp.]